MTIYKGHVFYADQLFPFHIDRYTIARGEVVPLHTHDFIELVYVYKGRATHDMAGQIYELSTGDVFVLEPNVYHSYKGSDQEETVVYNILFDIDFLSREIAVLQQLPSFIDFFYLVPFFRRNTAFIPYNPLKEYQRISMEHNLQTLLTEFKDKQEGYPLIIKTRLIECLVLLSRYHQENSTPVASTLSDEAYIHTITQFVEQHYNQPVTLEHLSRICGMSLSSFTSKFRSVQGQSLISFKQSIQIRKACAMLDTTSMKVLHIAHETGFNDISFFNRIFRKHIGMSPRAYRMRNGL